MSGNHADPEYPGETGERLDGRNLINEWVNKHSNSLYVWNKIAFDQIDVEKTDHVMGEVSRHALYINKHFREVIMFLIFAFSSLHGFPNMMTLQNISKSGNFILKLYHYFFREKMVKPTTYNFYVAYFL